jgi:hypothetical protein
MASYPIRRLTFKAYWLRDAPNSLTFNNCTLCPHCIYVFYIYLRTNSDLCHLHHKLVFITEMKSVYCAVRTGALNKAVCASSLNGLHTQIYVIFKLTPCRTDLLIRYRCEIIQIKSKLQAVTHVFFSGTHSYMFHASFQASAVKYLRTALLWVIWQRVVSGQDIGPIFRV